MFSRIEAAIALAVLSASSCPQVEVRDWSPSSGRRRSRTYSRDDARARQKRVQKWRKKKGYGCSYGQ